MIYKILMTTHHDSFSSCSNVVVNHQPGGVHDAQRPYDREAGNRASKEHLRRNLGRLLLELHSFWAPFLRRLSGFRGVVVITFRLQHV